jgi:CBS domain containing-hemolysin-like protein
MTLYDSLLRIGAVILLVLANAFFVASEFALVTVRRTRIEQLAAEGVSRAKAAAKAIADLDRFIAGTQVGITIASLALGWIGEPAVVRLIEPIFLALGFDATSNQVEGVATAIAFTLITFMHVVLGELVPKSLALQKPEATSLAVAHPMTIATKMFSPLIWALNGLGNRLLKALGLEAAGEHGSVHSPQELAILVTQSHAAGKLDDFEKKILQRSFRFGETNVSEIMVPRGDIIGLDLRKSPAELVEVAAQTSHTRLPVYDGTTDGILGVVYVHDIFRIYHETGQAPDFRRIMHTPLYIPEAFPLEALMVTFQEKRTQIAVVVDEYGGTAGLVTLEDVIETVFGEIQDQNEDPTLPIERKADGTIEIRGDARLVEIEEYVHCSFADRDSDTIAGFVMKSLGRVAQNGDEIRGAFGTLRITHVEGHRIRKVILDPKG